MFTHKLGINAIVLAVSALALVACACAEVDPGYLPGGPDAIQQLAAQSIKPCPCEEPCLAGPLIDTGPAPDVTGCSQIWIDCSPSTKRLTDLALPRYTRAAIELVSADEGYMTLLERLPSGSLKSLFKGYVYPGRKYLLWFCADDPGTHQIWYRSGYKESNRIRLHVSS